MSHVRNSTFSTGWQTMTAALTKIRQHAVKSGVSFIAVELSRVCCINGGQHFYCYIMRALELIRGPQTKRVKTNLFRLREYSFNCSSQHGKSQNPAQIGPLQASFRPKSSVVLQDLPCAFPETVGGTPVQCHNAEAESVVEVTDPRMWGTLKFEFCRTVRSRQN